MACERFLTEVGEWVARCIAEYSDLPPTDGHDQGTFTTGWEPYVKATGMMSAREAGPPRRASDEEAVRFMTALRDRIRDHHVGRGLWRHGYWTMQEAHHGTEHFELFLGALLRMNPGDGATCAQLVDAAEHMGNWAPEVPPWFDWEKGLFGSFYFGADGVRLDPGMEINLPEHMRCVNICLLAHQVSGEARFLDLSALYAGRWAEAVVASASQLPVGLDAGGPLYEIPGRGEKTYRSAAGQAPGLGPAVDRAENLLASDAAGAFLRLWRLTGDARLREAAERLLDVIATQLGDPDAGAAADAVRGYRNLTGGHRYDAAVLAAAGKLDPWGFETVSLDAPRPAARRPSGIGKRTDMPAWYEDGAPRRHNPVLLALAAEITRDESLAARAVDLSRAYLALAGEAFPHGRDHGCSARSVSAVARGHGRDNHAGVVTAVLGPVWEAFVGGRRG